MPHACAEAGISNYLNQTEKYSIGGSTEGPIYSTIDATSEDLHSFTYAQHTSTTPYASTSIVPFTNQSQAPAHSSEQQDDGHWITQPGPSGAQYAQPDRNNGKKNTWTFLILSVQLTSMYSKFSVFKSVVVMEQTPFSQLAACRFPFLYKFHY